VQKTDLAGARVLQRRDAGQRQTRGSGRRLQAGTRRELGQGEGAGAIEKAGIGECGHQAIQEEESSSFLKKRTKKLLIMLSLPALKKRQGAQPRDKSFLVLCFKKELLSSFSAPRPGSRYPNLLVT
jgi:hypothetical protein